MTFCIFLCVESKADSSCTERWLTFCEEQFNENTLPVCPEVLELKTCLAACANSLTSGITRIKYEALEKKVHSYPDCVPTTKGINILM